MLNKNIAPVILTLNNTANLLLNTTKMENIGKSDVSNSTNYGNSIHPNAIKEIKGQMKWISDKDLEELTKE